MILMFSSVIDVLGFIEEETDNSEKRVEAVHLIDSMECFEFVFTLHLLRDILGITSELSQALQRKDQDIVNAMRLVKVCKNRLQTMRITEDGWESLLNEVSSYCENHEISIPNMDDKHVVRGKSRRKATNKTNYEHYRVELFCTILDRQLQELNERFTEVGTELLISIASLNPKDCFAAYDKEQLICLAKMYPTDFSEADCMRLDSQLQNYIADMRNDERFSDLQGISELVKMFVEMKLFDVYPLVFRLLELALVLPVATASVERSFSAMKILKNRLRNRMEDKLLNDCMVTYVEKDVFDGVSNESIMQRFQISTYRRGQL